MLVTPDYFSAFTCSAIEATDVELPLPSAAKADLLNMLSKPDDYIYLTIRGDVHLETVCVKNNAGYLVMDRGLEGTQAVKHHTGSCVSSVSPTVIATIKDLICNWSCCKDGPCPCTDVTLKGVNVVSEGQVGRGYKAVLTFGGTVPMVISLSGLPSWATAFQTNNTVTVTGVPDKAGETKTHIAASNCSGASLMMSDDYVIRVKE